jgi:hypothetical protein
MKVTHELPNAMRSKGNYLLSKNYLHTSKFPVGEALASHRGLILNTMGKAPAYYTGIYVNGVYYKKITLYIAPPERAARVLTGLNWPVYIAALRPPCLYKAP